MEQGCDHRTRSFKALVRKRRAKDPAFVAKLQEERLQPNAETVKAPSKRYRHVQRTVDLGPSDIAAIEASNPSVDA
jgi:hypothetical protein